MAVGSSKMMTFALRRTARAFDHLPLRGAERLDDHRRIDRKVQRLKQLLRLDIGSPQAVEELLVTQIEVLRDRQRGNETRLLVDHCDPVAPRAGRTGNLYSLAVKKDFACRRRDSAGQDFDQRRFAGAVLAQNGVHLAAPQIEVDVFQRGDAPILLNDVFHLEEQRLRLRGRRHDVSSSEAHEATAASPLAQTKSRPLMARQLVTPWRRPFARLWRLAMGR